jgi:hypothetical protein
VARLRVGSVVLDDPDDEVLILASNDNAGKVTTIVDAREHQMPDLDCLLEHVVIREQNFTCEV